MLFEERKYYKNGRECSLFGAFPSDCTVRFTLTAKNADVHGARIEIHNDGLCSPSVFLTYEMTLTEKTDEHSVFCCELCFPRLLADSHLSDCGLFYYHYNVDGGIILGGERPVELDILDGYDGERQLFLCSPGYETSKTFRDGIVYHIFVDRFCRSGRSPVKSYAVIDEQWDGGCPEYAEYPGAPIDNRTFFGGDLWGVIEKLDYIASLGTKTIYLSPVFDAHTNHKYDTGDYTKVDTMFGGDAALSELCKAARERDIDVILDGVFNHTGSDSVYFNREGNYNSLGAYQSKSSPFFDWYKFREYPDSYECWWGVDILPRVDSSNDSYRSFICDCVIDKWMETGVAGWRLDVVDEISDVFLDDLRRAVKKHNPDGVIIGEVWEDATDKVSYGARRHYLSGSQLDSVMNYPLRNGVISYIRDGECDILRLATETLYRRYPKQSSDNLLNFLGTHDTERIITVLGGEDAGDKTNAELAGLKMNGDEKAAAAAKLKLAYSLICGLPGVPCVFYGDEAGLEGYRDPFCRRPFPWNDINGDLLAHYRKLGNIRRSHAVFRDGLFRLIGLTPEHVVYERLVWSDGDEKIVVAVVREGMLTVRFSSDVTELIGDKCGDEFTLSTGESAYFACSTDTEVIL